MGTSSVSAAAVSRGITTKPRPSWWSTVGAATAVVGPILLIVLLTSPLLFTNAHFDADWLVHLYYIWHQSVAIHDNYHPSLFLNYFYQVFYPQYAFYGGTLYALAGTFSALLGNAPLQVYIFTYFMGFVAAYGGWYWIARLVGLGRWQSHVPGLVFITSASYITILYGRGDWPEFICISVIPLVIAAGFSVLRSDRLRFWPALALACSSVVFFGSHNITLLWAATFFTSVGLAVVVFVPAARKELTRRRIFRVSGLMMPALLVNAWYLLPDIAYESRTWAGSGNGNGNHFWDEWLHYSMSWVGAKHLFTLSRVVPKQDDGHVFALPLLMISWVIVSVVIALRVKARGPWMRTVMLLSCVTFSIGLLMTHAGLIDLLPPPYRILLFSYRLESYVIFGLSGTVMAALVVAMQSDSRHFRLWTWVLVPVLLASLLGVVQQLNTLPHGGGRETALSSYLEPVLAGSTKPLLLEDYANTLPLVNTTSPSDTIFFPPDTVHDDHASKTVHFFPGERINSNIGGGPEMVHVTGATIVGRSPQGGDVLEITPRSGATSQEGSPTPTETITLSPAHSLPIVLGRLLTLAGVLLLAVQFVALAMRRRAKA